MRNSTLYKNAPVTFRRSSTKILDWYGGNLQNIEKSLRQIYKPDGYSPALLEKCIYWLKTGDHTVFTEEELAKLRVLLQVDQSGAEDLVVSYDTTAGPSRQCYEHGIKKHTYVAMMLFKEVWPIKMKEMGGLVEDFDIDKLCATSIPQLKHNPFWYDLNKLIKSSDDWSLTERYYYFAKQTVHSANYDIQAPHFQMNILEKSGGKIMIPIKECERFLMVYRALFPEIPARNRRVAQQVEQSRMLFNLLGFPYQITDWNVMTSTMKDMYAWGPQSTVGEITRRAFTGLQEYIEDTRQKWDIMADTHDSYLAQCPLVDVKDCRIKMLQFMCQKMTSPVDGVEFYMKAECNIGFNWASQKDSNPLGLQELSWL